MSSSHSSNSSDDSSNNGEQVDMEALLEEMGEEDGDDDNGAAFAEDSDSSDSSVDGHSNHEMEDNRMRRLMRASSTGTLESDPHGSCRSSDAEEEEHEPASESSDELTGQGEDDDDEEDEEEEEELIKEDVVPEVEEEEGSVIDEDDIEDTLERKPKEKKEKLELPKISDSIDENDPEAIEMKKLLGEWGVDEDKNDKDDSDSDDGSDDEDERIVILDPNVLDHIVLAAPDLDEAIAEFEQMTGTKPIVAGTINGLGIRCARVSFNDSSYLEIIAPDHKKIGPIGTLLKTKDVKHLTPFAFAIRTNRAEELKKEVEKFTYIPDHITMFGGSKEGEPMKWEVCTFMCSYSELLPSHSLTAVPSRIIVAHYSFSFCTATNLVACARTLSTGTTANTLALSSLSLANSKSLPFALPPMTLFTNSWRTSMPKVSLWKRAKANSRFSLAAPRARSSLPPARPLASNFPVLQRKTKRMRIWPLMSTTRVKWNLLTLKHPNF